MKKLKQFFKGDRVVQLYWIKRRPYLTTNRTYAIEAILTDEGKVVNVKDLEVD